MSTVTRNLEPIAEVAPDAGYTPKRIREWIHEGIISAEWDEKRKLWLVNPDEVHRVAKARQKHIPRPFTST